MGYLHILNLYKASDILMFRECYAMEKVHGTSAHISWKGATKEVTYFSGGESYEKFKALFDEGYLEEQFEAIVGPFDAVVYGEAYGGKCQGMSGTYGKELKFIVFDVTIGDNWLSVPDAEDVAKKLGLEFVPYNRVSTDTATLDAQRDLPSRVAKLRGIAEDKMAEGIVCRPLIELTKNNGDRIIVKHKRAEFSERASKKDTLPPDKVEVLAKAEEIAKEWVTPMRLTHVLDKIPGPLGMENTKAVLSGMLEDVYREAGEEVVRSKESDRAISNLTVKLFKERLKEAQHEVVS